MAWIDAQYCINAIGQDQGESLGLLDDMGAVTDRFTQYELEGRACVVSVLQYAGYPAPDVTLVDTSPAAAQTNAFLKKLAFSVLIQDAYSLVKGIALSQETVQGIQQGLALLQSVYDKRLPVPGMQPSAADGYGGSQFNTAAQPTQPTTLVFRTLRYSTF